MIKSSFLKEFQAQLSELNNYFSHYLFIWEQFHLDYSETLQKKKDLLTTDYFKENAFSPQWRVELGLLGDNHKKTKEFILKSMYLLSFSQFEYYNRDIYEFVRKLDSSIPNIDRNAQIPNDILTNLNIELENIFDEEEIFTLHYLRLRRNRVVHRGSAPNHELRDIIKQKGNGLNKFWNNKLRNGLYSLSFQDLEINDFSKNEVFDLINIYRSVTKKIDSAILSNVDRNALINYLKSEFNSAFSSKIKTWNEQRLKSKFQGFCKHKFNLKLSGAESFKLGDVA